MPEVFRNDRKIVCVGEAWIRRLKEAAAASPLRRARLCLHRADGDAVQEMIIALCRDVLFRPHRHEAKSESFHVIEGELDVVVFGARGAPERVIRMGPPGSGRVVCYRLSASAWHAILPRSEFVVFHEATAGPYLPGEPAQFAPWAPTRPAALRAFLEAACGKRGSSSAKNRPKAASRRKSRSGSTSR
jgi:cupin fold WbuC family metalloprotein